MVGTGGGRGKEDASCRWVAPDMLAGAAPTSLEHRNRTRLYACNNRGRPETCSSESEVRSSEGEDATERHRQSLQPTVRPMSAVQDASMNCRPTTWRSASALYSVNTSVARRHTALRSLRVLWGSQSHRTRLSRRSVHTIAWVSCLWVSVKAHLASRHSAAWEQPTRSHTQQGVVWANKELCGPTNVRRGWGGGGGGVSQNIDQCNLGSDAGESDVSTALTGSIKFFAEAARTEGDSRPSPLESCVTSTEEAIQATGG